MAILRTGNWLGQQRIDLPHLRAVESGVRGDFDLLAGTIFGGGQPLVIKGFELTNVTVNAAANAIQMVVAGSALINLGATESGSIFSVPLDRSPELLTSTNPRVSGAFTASATNFIGIDTRRAADSTTSDVVQFLGATTLVETAKTVPLAQTLDYVIVIGTQDFSAQPYIVPIAKVVTNSTVNIVSVTDARPLAFRLASGGDNPDSNYAYPWPGTRSATVSNPFQGGDRAITSQKEWQDAVMTRIWEIGGGEAWHSATADRNVSMVYYGAAFTNGEHFAWDGTNLTWQGLRFIFDNSTAFYNNVAAQTISSAGLTNLVDGECIYVDLNRSTNAATIVGVKATLATLGPGSIPGARMVIAWNVGGTIHTRNWVYQVGATFTPATTTSTGVVRLSATPGSTQMPVVLTLDANNAVSVGTVAWPILSGDAFIVTAGGAGNGVSATATSGRGINATATTGYGVYSTSTNDAGFGVYGKNTSTSGGVGIKGEANRSVLPGITSATGVLGIATSSVTGSSIGVSGGSDSGGLGVFGISGSLVRSLASGIGVYGVGPVYGTAGEGPTGVYGMGTAYGVRGDTAAVASGVGVRGDGETGTSGHGSNGAGVAGYSTGGLGAGVYGNGPNAGVRGTGNTVGVHGGYANLGDPSSITGTSGYGSLYGVKGNTDADSSWGVYGGATGVGAIAVAGVSTQSIGVYGAGDTYGVQGIGNLVGVRGETSAQDTIAVYGVCSHTLGTVGVSGEGSVGVWGNTNSGGYGLLSGNGDIGLPTTKQVKYSGTQNGALFIGPAEFTILTASVFLNPTNHRWEVNGTIGMDLLANFHLPRGATITAIDISAGNGGGVNVPMTVTCQLIAAGETAPVPYTVFSGSTPDVPGGSGVTGLWYPCTPILPTTNTGGTLGGAGASSYYSLRIVLASTSPTIEIKVVYGARITYSYQNIDFMS